MPAPLHRPKGMLHELLALFHDLGSGMYTRLHLFEQRLVHPACEPPAPFMARALGLERAGATSRGRIGAQVAPTLDGVETTAEPRTGGTALRVRGRRRREIVCAEEPQLLMG